MGFAPRGLSLLGGGGGGGQRCEGLITTQVRAVLRRHGERVFILSGEVGSFQRGEGIWAWKGFLMGE